MKDVIDHDDPVKKPKRFMLISDPHFFSMHSDFLEIISNVHKYGEEHECDELIVGGDISERDVYEVKELIMDEVFDGFKIAKGNHDKWKIPDLYRSIEDGVKEEKDILIGRKLIWEEGTYDDISMALAHRPHDFGIRSSYTEYEEELIDDVIIYGHSHAAFDRILGNKGPEGEGSVVIGIGSVYENHNTPYRDRQKMPDRSFQIMELDGEEITLEHYDFDHNYIVEKSLYEKNLEGFRMTSKEIYADILQDSYSQEEVLSYA